MPRKPGTLGRHKCCVCGEVKLAAGGGHTFKCEPCRAALPPSKENAHYLVARAIRRGELARPSEFQCVDCGRPAIEYDHRDYSKPLEVAPVCRSCNLRRGPAKEAA